MKVLIDQAGHEHLIDEAVVDDVVRADDIDDFSEIADGDDAITLHGDRLGERTGWIDRADGRSVDRDRHALGLLSGR